MAFRVLTVCLGNICRSPVAEEAIRAAAERAGIEIEVDSAGTGSWHVGQRPHEGSRKASAAVGLELKSRARVISPEDFDRFDLILAMDRANLEDLLLLSPSSSKKIRLLMEFDPDSLYDEVPDPYYGTQEDFERMVELILPAAEGVIEAIEQGKV